MESGSNNHNPESFDSGRVGYLLESAALAARGGNSRLAIHLYCAAFEASQVLPSGVDERTLAGLRQAWTLACEQGDRSTAEAIFNDLAPYNSDEQTREALAELQNLAVNQLEQLGLSKEEIKDMAVSLADEFRDAGIDVHALTNHLDDLDELGALAVRAPAGMREGGRSLLAELMSAGHTSALSALDTTQEEEDQELVLPPLRYAQLASFDVAKQQMRAFGLVDHNNAELLEFLRQAESLHGVSGPVLSQNFLFTGPSREDCGIFAQATALEIGWPTITMAVEINENGDGVIKVMAPVRRSFFGPPRVTDLPQPCTLVIQNIDLLQTLMLQQSGLHRSSAQHEILGYLSALVTRGGVFFIATAAAQGAHEEQDAQEAQGSQGSWGAPQAAPGAQQGAQPPRRFELCEQLEHIMGSLVPLTVPEPNYHERLQVLAQFAESHPSFQGLDQALLARLSEGMARFHLMHCCRLAVEQAYGKSLKTQCHHPVKLDDILSLFLAHLARQGSAYRIIEDYLVTRFSEELEQEISLFGHQGHGFGQSGAA